MQALAEQQAKLRAEQARDRRKSSFRAAPPPRFPQPPAPARSERPATRALTPKLAVETRSTARAAFDAMVAENKRKEEASLWPTALHCTSAQQLADVLVLHCMLLVLPSCSHASCVPSVTCPATAQRVTVPAVIGTLWKSSQDRIASSSVFLWDGALGSKGSD